MFKTGPVDSLDTLERAQESRDSGGGARRKFVLFALVEDVLACSTLRIFGFAGSYAMN